MIRWCSEKINRRWARFRMAGFTSSIILSRSRPKGRRSISVVDDSVRGQGASLQAVWPSCPAVNRFSPKIGRFCQITWRWLRPVGIIFLEIRPQRHLPPCFKLLPEVIEFGGGARLSLRPACCLIGADVQHQGEADLFPGKGGEFWASLWKEA